MTDPDTARRLELAADGALDLADAAAFLSLCQTQVRKLLDLGHLVGGLIGRRRVVSRRSLQEYLARSFDLRAANPEDAHADARQ